LRVHIDGIVWHLDVVLSLPGAEEGSKGLAVRQLIATHEMGLERCKTVWSLSVIKISKFRSIRLVREDWTMPITDFPIVKNRAWVS